MYVHIIAGTVLITKNKYVCTYYYKNIYAYSYVLPPCFARVFEVLINRQPRIASLGPDIYHLLENTKSKMP